MKMKAVQLACSMAFKRLWKVEIEGSSPAVLFLEMLQYDMLFLISTGRLYHLVSLTTSTITGKIKRGQVLPTSSFSCARIVLCSKKAMMCGTKMLATPLIALVLKNT